MAKCLLPKELLAQCSNRFKNQHATWLTGGGNWPLSFALGLPSEKEALDDIALVRRWSEAWHAWTERAGASQAGCVQYVERNWARLGKQNLPARLQFEDAAQFAACVGEAQRWQRAQARYTLMTTRWPQFAANTVLSRKYAELADYAEEDFTRLLSLLTWLQANPASGLYLRQLPVVGLDTKWADPRKKILVDLLRVLFDRQDENDFYALCGLQAQPIRLRLRVLCPTLRQTLGGLCDIEAPLAELARLSLQPQRLLIVENLATGLALPDIHGCVAIMGLGNAVTLLARIPWLQDVPALYWGDIDTYGFSILHAARSVLPQVRSVLMDEATLAAHSPLWGEEPNQQTEQSLALLTAEENTLYRRLHSQHWQRNLRLEQERIAWDFALAQIEIAWREMGV